MKRTVDEAAEYIDELEEAARRLVFTNHHLAKSVIYWRNKAMESGVEDNFDFGLMPPMKVEAKQ